MLLGPMAIVISVISMGMKNDRILRILGVLSCILWAAYFIVGGHYSGAAMNILAVLMISAGLLGWATSGRALMWLGISTIPVSLGAVIAGSMQLLATLPFLGSSMMNIGMVCMAGRQLTLSLIAGQITWGAYAFLTEAWSSLWMALISLGALAWREYSGARSSKASEEQCAIETLT